MINFNGTMKLNGQISTPRHPIDSRFHVKNPLHFPGISKHHVYWHSGEEVVCTLDVEEKRVIYAYNW